MTVDDPSRSYRRTFPFDYIRENWGKTLQGALRKIELEDQWYPHANITIALNCVLVWAGARTITLPIWKTCNEQCVYDFIALLNKIGSQIPSRIGRVEEIYVLYRPQRFRNSRETIRQRLIARRNDPSVRLAEDPPLDDREIGNLLGMYPRNVELFAGGWLESAKHPGFEVREAESDVSLFAEVFSDSDLKCCQQTQHFRVHCEEQVSSWNETMKNLGLEYQFYGIVHSLRHSESIKTEDVFGSEYLGEKRRWRATEQRVQRLEGTGYWDISALGGMSTRA